MALIDSLNPQKNVYLPNSEELVTLVLVPQHSVFALNKEVKKYLGEFDLLNDPIASKLVYEAAILIRAIRKHGTANIAENERGEQLFQSIDSFLMRFNDDQQEWLMAHYEILKREVLPPVSELTETDLEKLFEDIDSGKDLSPSLKDFGYASLLTFTLSLVNQLRQLREASPTKNSPTGYFFSEKKRKSSERAAARREGADADKIEA